MEALQALDLQQIPELKILRDVRLLQKHDLNHVYSKTNLRVQFTLEGDVFGVINCVLCLDGHELSEQDRNYIVPLFIETMNILVGTQLSRDPKLDQRKTKLGPPRLNLNPTEINSAIKISLQKYQLELQSETYSVLVENLLQVLN